MADFYIDIETVRQYKDFEDAPARAQELFRKRHFSDHYRKQNPDMSIYDRWNEHAGLTAEFGKIVCLSVSWFKEDGSIATKLFTGPEVTPEKTGILDMFNVILTKNQKCRLIAHNGKKFDFPIITRRLIINGIPVLSPLNAYGKKPWEMYGLLDTVDMWASTEFNPYVSLDVLCDVLGVDSPKEGEVTGETVGDFYWNDPVGSLHAIGQYCGRDTIALAKVHKILDKMLVPGIG